MVIAQGDIVWVDFDEPKGSEPAKPRPAVVVQGDAWNRSTLQTTLVVPLTSNLDRATLPGNVRLRPRDRLLKPSVASVVHLGAIDRSLIVRRLGRVSPSELEAIVDGVLLVLGRTRA
jgi:mRNA interferase MazF